MDDMYREVQKARVVVVPGITAMLNSTVREAMLMKKPVVLYETEATIKINREKQCLIVAKMKDIEDLSNKMLLAIENTELANEVALNGFEYAKSHYSNNKIGLKLANNIKSIVDFEKKQTPIPEDLIWYPER